MAIVTTPLGFKKPDGNELANNGDNVISDNAQKAEDRHQEARGRLDLVEAKNTTQDGRLDVVETTNVAQDGTLATYAARLANLDNAAGFTGDPLALNDAAFAETLTNGTETHAALEDRLDIQVPPIVAAAIADDPTVASSAADMAQSTAGLVPVWKATTAYVAAQRVIAPNGDVVAAKVNFTSGASYNAANWTASTQDARTAVLESSAGLADLITNGTFRNGLTGWTNTGAWVVQTNTNAVTSWARTMSGGDGAFAQSIVVPSRLIGSTLRLKVLAMTTSTGTLITTITTTSGATTQNHTLSTSYVEYTLNVAIPAGQGTTPITLNVGRYTGTVYMTSIRLEAL